MKVEAAMETSPKGSGLVLLRGRQNEMEWLLSALDLESEVSGRARILLGPSGVGKSRLVSEAAKAAETRGFLALSSRSQPLDRRLAYAPFLQMFGPHLRRLAPASRAAIIEGLRPLGRILPGMGLGAPEEQQDVALQKTRLFETVRLLCARLSADRPLLLAFDDLQFADSNSIALFAFLARAVPDAPVVLLATCNSERVDEAPDLLPAIRSLSRSRLCEVLQVAPMGGDDLAGIVSDLLGGDPPDALLSVLRTRTGGIPLFALEWTQALIEAGRLFRRHGAWVLDTSPPNRIPPRVQEVISERLNRLAPGPREMLALVATNGGEMDYSLLRAVATDSADLDANVGRLVETHLLAEQVTEDGLGFRVSHPLVAEVMYGSLPAVMRRHYHLAILGALEKEPQAASSLLAYHYRACGPAAGSPRALEALIGAGEQQARLGASHEAASYFSAALALVRAGVQSARPDLLPELLAEIADAEERYGAYDAAVRDRREALELRQERGEMAQVARLRLGLAMTEWARGRHGTAWAHLTAGIRALDGVAVSPEHVMLHHGEVMFLARLGRDEGMAAAAEASRVAAQRLGTPALSALAHLAEAVHLFSSREPGRRRFPRLQETVRQVETTGVDESIYRACVIGAVAGASLGYPRAAYGYSRRAVETGRRLGSLSMQEFGLSLMMVLNLYLGDWRAADRLGARLMALDRRIGIPRDTAIALASWAMVLGKRGETATAEVCLAEAQEIYGDGLRTDVHAMAVLRLAQATLAIESGRAAGMPFVSADFAGELHVTLFAQRMGAIAEILVLRGDVATAERALSHIEHEDCPLSAAVGARVRGLLARSRGDRSRALSGFQAAAEKFASLEMPVETAEARLDRLEMVADRKAATREGTDLLAYFHELGCPRLEARAQKFASGPDAATLVLDAEPADTGLNLTSRQWEIAALVAHGLTNAEIAERLVISVRTVTTHMTHIFNKLNLGSRSALVRYVMEYEYETERGA